MDFKQAQLQISQIQESIQAQDNWLNELQNQVNVIQSVSTPPQNPSGSVNQIRNGDYSQSVASWFADAAADDRRYEAAWWYSHPIDAGQPMYEATTRSGVASVSFASGNVSTADDTIDIGQYMATGFAVTAVAGALPAPLVTATQYYVINYDATKVRLATSYANAIAGTRIDLTTTGGAGNTLTFVYALMEATSTKYSAAFSDWNFATGAARIQGATDVSCFFPGRNIQPSYTYYFTASFVRLNQYVTAPTSARLFAGLYAKSPTWNWINGDFDITATVSGTIATPTSRDYLVHTRTNRGFSVNSSVLTVANAPSDADFAGGARVVLQWPRVLNFGVSGYDVYRNTGGTYRSLFSVANGTTYIDNGAFADTAIAYPSADFSGLVAYTASTANIMSQISYIGDPLIGDWTSIWFAIRTPQNYNVGNTDFSVGQWLRFGFQGVTGNLDLQMSDGFTSAGGGTTTTLKTTASGRFTAAQVGLNIDVSSSDGTLIVSTTIATYVSANEITIGSAISKGLSDLIVYVHHGAPAHALYVDLAHVDFVQGAAYSPNAEDIHPDRNPPAVTPAGSSQGGSGSGGPPNTGDGGPTCLFIEEAVMRNGVDTEIGELKYGDKLDDGNGGLNTVVEIKDGTDTIWYVATENGADIRASETKQIYISATDKKPISQLKKGDKILTHADGVIEPSAIVTKHKLFRGVVRQIGLRPNDRFLAGCRETKIVVSNVKPILIEQSVQ